VNEKEEEEKVTMSTDRDRTFLCSKCTKTFTRERSLKHHENNYCKYRTTRGNETHQVKSFKMRKRGNDDGSGDGDDSLNDECTVFGENSIIELDRQSLTGAVSDYKMIPNDVIVNVDQWLIDEKPCVATLIDRFEEYDLRARLVLRAWFIKRNPVTQQIMKRIQLHISSYSTEQIVDFNDWYQHHCNGITKHLEYFHENESDLQFDGVDCLFIKLNKKKNWNAQSTFKLPAELMKRKAVINVDSKEACFKYAVLSVLHYHDVPEHKNRVNNYQTWESDLIFNGIDVNNINIRKDLAKFEKSNSLKVNIHLWQNGLKGCIYNSKIITDQTVNILLVVNSEGERHYVGIPRLSRLYFKENNTSKSKFMCERCCQSFWSKRTLEIHFQLCFIGKLQNEIMPKEKEYTYQTIVDKELNPLKVIYADIECLIDNNEHKPAAIACYEVLHPNAKESSKANVTSWTGDSCIKNFLKYLNETVHEQYKNNHKFTREKMKITKLQQEEFYACTSCPRCKKVFDENNKKVRDHCHISGKYRGPLCFKCNGHLRLKRRMLSVVFHNFKNYDAHIVIKHGLSCMKDWKLQVIPQSKEKFISLVVQIPVDKTKKGKIMYFTIKFLDSYLFLSSSLSKLVSNLDSLPITNQLKKKYPLASDEIFQRKGVFPYSYFTSFSCLQEKRLPPKKAFYDDLNEEECSNEDYEHAQRAWTEFGCDTFEDYMLAYLYLDVLLLADVFEKFRQVCLKEDEIDPIHYFTLPSLSYSSAFKMTGETIHLLQDLEMYRMFERGIRGGLTFVNIHKAEAMISEDENKRVHLLYLDQNNLYGHSLCQPLPHSDFSWIEDNTPFSQSDYILNLDDEGEWGYFLEVDLKYPLEIHEKTSDFPLAPESGMIAEDMFSDFMIKMYQTINENDKNKRKYKSSRKLLLTQYDKYRYPVHFKILKFYLKMGMKLEKVHHVIRFRQKRWLKPYIDYNSKKRSQAANDFEKDYYKLKNNSLYGKTMEDVRKRMDYKLIHSREEFDKLQVKPLFHSRDIITDDLIGVKMLKVNVKLDKPIYVGQAVLDYSKLEMYELFYETLPQCSLINKLKLLGGDTDSFFLEIHTSKDISLSDIFKELSCYIDTSNYPLSHPMYSIQNKAKLGCFKDESCGRAIEEIIMLRPKMYSLKFKNDVNTIKRAKGITRSVVTRLNHNEYRAVFEQLYTTKVDMTVIQSRNHSLNTVTFRKRALCAWEDKRVWIDVNESLPHGNVGSPVPPPKRRRIALPPSGDVI
jgi:hypothetical protein